jgi:phosphoribosyl-dephospho-CoA transferase
VRLGVPLPPNEGKQRLSLRVPMQHVVCHQSPLSLRDVITRLDAHLPDDWRDALTALDTLQPARVFGAFAWQALTGLRCVQAGSDIDLLWPVPSPAQAPALLADLARWEQRHGCRADGEVLLPDGDAVSWRELAGDSAQLLVKALRDCRLQPRTELLQAWGA